MNMTFEKVCKYAQQFYSPRMDKSRSKDITQTFWQYPWGTKIMVLYEGQRRTLRGHDKPEVCWICIDNSGKVSSLASRNIRKMKQIAGFRFNKNVADMIKELEL